MKIDPTLLKGFRVSLAYGLGAFLFFHFLGDGEASMSDKLIKAAATAGIFLLLYYVTARVMRGKKKEEE